VEFDDAHLRQGDDGFNWIRNKILANFGFFLALHSSERAGSPSLGVFKVDTRRGNARRAMKECQWSARYMRDDPVCNLVVVARQLYFRDTQIGVDKSIRMWNADRAFRSERERLDLALAGDRLAGAFLVMAVQVRDGCLSRTQGLTGQLLPPAPPGWPWPFIALVTKSAAHRFLSLSGFVGFLRSADIVHFLESPTSGALGVGTGFWTLNEVALSRWSGSLNASAFATLLGHAVLLSIKKAKAHYSDMPAEIV
jgi:hypothetical protein